MGSSQSKRRANQNKIAEPNTTINPLENPDDYWLKKQDNKVVGIPLVHLMEDAIIRSNYDVLEWYCFNEIHETNYWTRDQFKNAVLKDKLSKSSGSNLISLCRKTGKLTALRIFGISNLYIYDMVYELSASSKIYSVIHMSSSDRGE